MIPNQVVLSGKPVSRWFRPVAVVLRQFLVYEVEELHLTCPFPRALFVVLYDFYLFKATISNSSTIIKNNHQMLFTAEILMWLFFCVCPDSQLCMSFVITINFCETIQNVSKTSKNVILFGLVIISKYSVGKRNSIKNHAPCESVSVWIVGFLFYRNEVGWIYYKVQRNSDEPLFHSVQSVDFDVRLLQRFNKCSVHPPNRCFFPVKLLKL